MTDLRTRAAMAANPAAQDPTDPTGPFAAVDERIASAVADGTGIDLSTSGIEASMDVSAAVAWSRVMGEVQYVRKGSRREDFGGKYNFRGIDEVLNAVGPALRKHGVTVAQTKVVPVYDTVLTGNNKTMQRCKVTVTYGIVGPRGDLYPLTLESVGEAFDAGDKSTPKAVSVALRSFYINNLAIPTDQPAMDPEHGPQYETATPPPPTAAEYRAEIIKSTTSLERLRAIHQELERHPAIGEEIVSDIDEAEMPLIGLLRKIGRERKAKGEA